MSPSLSTLRLVPLISLRSVTETVTVAAGVTMVLDPPLPGPIVGSVAPGVLVVAGGFRGVWLVRYNEGGHYEVHHFDSTFDPAAVDPGNLRFFAHDRDGGRLHSAKFSG